MRSVALFGATGSVGQSAADVIAAHPGKFSVGVVTANTDAQALAHTAQRLDAKKAVIADEAQAEALSEKLAGTGIIVEAGRDALLAAADEQVDITLAAISGMAGLEPLLRSINSSSAVAIANKEPLVAAGALVMKMAKEQGCTLLPVDSEHNAIFQVFEKDNAGSIEKIILTASGGPFRTWTKEQMAKATPQQALAHPNWSMGAKISIDSATMMNKALEVIEAHYLFDMPADQIVVIIHPQSIIHSMVEYVDGSVLAQLGAPDMKTPISYCLGWPERIKTPGQRLDLTAMKTLDFEPVNDSHFPAISLAYAALKAGQGGCIAMNAANEVAVQAFLEGDILFPEIIELASQALKQQTGAPADSLEAILALDEKVRKQTLSAILEKNQRLKA